MIDKEAPACGGPVDVTDQWDPTDDIEKDAAGEALDKIAALCGCAPWEYPGQVVRDVQTVVASRDQLIRQAPEKAERARVKLAEAEAWRDALGSALRDLLAELKAKREAAAAPWEAECEIIEGYMPPFPDHDTQPKVVIRHKPSNRFLRHSGGPRQGHFWDIYGDHYQTVELAAAALSLSPHPTERGCNEPGPLARPGNS